MPIAAIEAIDVHGHYGAFENHRHELIRTFRSGSAEEVVRCAKLSNISHTVVSPLTALMPRGGGDAVRGNDEAEKTVERIEGLLQWVVIDPNQPRTYDQAKQMLRHDKCVGIKIHPEEHRYPITERGHQIFRFAAEHGAVVLAHTGESNSLPEDFVPFANEFAEMKLILAHLGNGYDGDPTHQVRAIQSGRHGNLFVDTSSANSITPKLIEWATREVGAERILFGTDTPLYFSPMQKVRIEHADIGDHEKRLILRDNAVRLLQLSAIGIN